jgi:DNA-binding TFAR19-related protein (PDSD5 family)
LETDMPNMNKSRAAVVATMCLAVSGAIAASDALDQLGVPVEIARQEVNAAIERGVVNYAAAAPAFKAASGTVRAQLALGAIAWAKSYTASDAFNAEYAGMRDARKPLPPDFQGTPDDERQQLLDRQMTEIQRSKVALESLNPESRTQMEDAVNQAAAAMRQLDTPEMRTMQLAGIHYARAESTTKYEAALQAWDAEYPEAPARVIARRLKAFLAASASVDFSAKLELRNGRMRFVDAADEARSGEWKLCYRAGKEAVDAARLAAAAWLHELEPVNQSR